MKRNGFCIGAVVLLASVFHAQAISILFDYTYDTNHFFDTAAKKNALAAAAHVYETSLTDSLLAITPNAAQNNTWDEIFLNPSGAGNLTITGTSIAANTVLIYVGAQSLGGSYGESLPGSYSPGGINSPPAWGNVLKARGQTGALNSPATDFGPWGGGLSFNLSSQWYFDTDPSTVSDLPAGSVDFFTVAEHEIGHVLGLGTSASWTAKISSGSFIGTNAEAAYNGPVPLSGNDHWNSGVTSTIYGTTTPQEAEMTPSLATGARKYLTTLDFAALQDVGWQVAAPVPEPSSLVLVGIFCGGVFWFRKSGGR